jgi:hypothetical protein
MPPDILAFPRAEAEYRWFEILDESLIHYHIVPGDIVECHLEQLSAASFPYVLLYCGHILIRYIYVHNGIARLVSTAPRAPIILVNVSDVQVIGRIVRVYQDGAWRCFVPAAHMDDFWLRWANEEAS